MLPTQQRLRSHVRPVRRSTIGWNSSRNSLRSIARCRSASRLTRLAASPPERTRVRDQALPFRPLRRGERDVGFAQQVFGAGESRIRAAHSDACGNGEAMAPQLERRAQAILQRAGHFQRRFVVEHVEHQQRELTSLEPGQLTFDSAHRLPETLRRLHHQLVASRMASVSVMRLKRSMSMTATATPCRRRPRTSRSARSS